MLHRTTVRGADLIEGTVDSLVRNRGFIVRNGVVAKHLILVLLHALHRKHVKTSSHCGAIGAVGLKAYF